MDVRRKLALGLFPLAAFGIAIVPASAAVADTTPSVATHTATADVNDNGEDSILGLNLFGEDGENSSDSDLFSSEDGEDSGLGLNLFGGEDGENSSDSGLFSSEDGEDSGLGLDLFGGEDGENSSLGLS